MGNEKKPLVNLSSIMSNGGAIALATVAIYYFVTLRMELTYNAMGIPTQFIEFPFYNLVKQVQDLFIFTLPILYFTLLLLRIILMRIEIFQYKKEDIEIPDSYGVRQLSEKKMAFDIVLTFMFILIFINISKNMKESMQYLDFIYPVSISCVYIFFQYFIYLIIKKNLGKENTSIKYERFYKRTSILFVLIIFYGHIVTLYQFVSTAEEPYKILVINDETGFKKKMGAETLYNFQYLVSEKDGYGVWAIVELRKHEDTQSNELVIIDTVSRFEMKPMENISVVEVEVKRKFDIHEDNTNNFSSFSVNLMFENWEQVDRLFAEG